MPDQFECSEQTEVPSDKKIGYSNQIERPAQLECLDQAAEPTEKDGVFSFHTKQVDACENGLSFHTENSAPPTVCILDLGCTRAMGSRKAVDVFADMLTHIPTVVSGMKFNRRVQDSSLQTLSNPSAQRKLSYSCMTMAGIPNSQSSTLWKKVMSHF